MTRLINVMGDNSFGYDDLGRLASSTPTGSGTVRQQSFGYDSFGNMLPAWSATAPSVTGRFNASNRLVAQSASDCLSYDAAGNLTCTGTPNTYAHQYLFNEEGELVIASVAQNSTANQVGVYSFDSSGRRFRSDNPTAQTWREYSYFNGQILAEKDNTGNWTDHIYANGKRLATVRPTTVLHHSGVCGECYAGLSNFVVPQLASELQGYTLRPGDKLLFQQKQTNARAGLYMYATDGTNSMCGLVDQFGDCMNSSSQADGTWKTRLVDLGS